MEKLTEVKTSITKPKLNKEEGFGTLADALTYFPGGKL